MKKIWESMKKNYWYGICLVLLITIIVLGTCLHKKSEKYALEVENQYNLAFYELINYVQNVETYLAKALISSTPEHSAETLTNAWREANLGQVYLAQLPSASGELSKATKFLNQVSEYTYSLSRKGINNEKMSEEDLKNIEELHNYSLELINILSQLASDMDSGRVSWKDLTKQVDTPFAQQVDNLSKVSFSNIDENFGEYQGLIYDGAFSEHMERQEKKGLIGEDINEDEARKIAENFVGKDKIKEIYSNGLMENANIVLYDFGIKLKNGNDQNQLTISISKKGGHIVLMNYNREVKAEVINNEKANEIGKDFLKNHNLDNMEPTYYLKQAGVITINYAYEQDGVIVYPDLIKVKIALDNGEVLGVETRGYLNCHYFREDLQVQISSEEAKKDLNKSLEITNERLAIIPTIWKTEILCYEFTGKIKDMDFLVYVNAKTGKEENVILIVNTPNGVVAQ